MSVPSCSIARIVGLTGGIACGKTAASAVLRRLGATVIDADTIAASVTEKGGACHAAIIALFGADIVLPNGLLDRRSIAKSVFADESLRRRLNEIVHPKVLAELHRQTAALTANDKNALAVWEVPLLFESGIDAMVGHTLLVTASDELRVKRLVTERGYSEHEAIARIAAQMPESQKIARADCVIYNNGSLAELERALQIWYNGIQDGRQ